MGVWIMAGVTFREAARKKMLWMALAAGSAFLILFGTGLHFQAKDFAAHGMSPVLRREISFTMVTMGLYAVDLLAVLMTILTSIDTLSGEIASGTIQAIAAKPVCNADSSTARSAAVNTTRMKKCLVSTSLNCWASRMFCPLWARKVETAETMPGRSGQERVSTYW